MGVPGALSVGEYCILRWRECSCYTYILSNVRFQFLPPVFQFDAVNRNKPRHNDHDSGHSSAHRAEYWSRRRNFERRDIYDPSSITDVPATITVSGWTPEFYRHDSGDACALLRMEIRGAGRSGLCQSLFASTGAIAVGSRRAVAPGYQRRVRICTDALRYSRDYNCVRCYLPTTFRLLLWPEADFWPRTFRLVRHPIPTLGYGRPHFDYRGDVIVSDAKRLRFGSRPRRTPTPVQAPSREPVGYPDSA